jgi:hypothetical protein
MLQDSVLMQVSHNREMAGYVEKISVKGSDIPEMSGAVFMVCSFNTGN